LSHSFKHTTGTGDEGFGINLTQWLLFASHCRADKALPQDTLIRIFHTVRCFALPVRHPCHWPAG
jgi:hypothetical protein